MPHRAALKLAAAVAIATAGVLVAPDTARAQFHTPMPVFTDRDTAVVRSLVEDADTTRADANAGLRLFGRLSTGFTSDRAYIATSVVSGFIGNKLFEVTYARVVSAEDGDTPDQRALIRDRVSTVTRLVQNGGAATARLMVPILPVDGVGSGNGRYQLQAHFDGGAVGRPSDDAGDDDRGALGMGLEALATWRVQDRPAGAPVATVHLGLRGAVHQVFNGRILDDVGRRTLPVGQAVFIVRQNNTIAFGVTATMVPSAFRPYVPRTYFLVSADIL
ncbi:MAG TPA: hypothetical protein VFY16_14230 [Gemmatimonadaceae bacterium]|nr:hypothetical protein [Gemmatimonadaceae bacterium]